MISLTENGLSERLLRSVQVLASLFEHKFGLKLEVLSQAPTEESIDGLQFGHELRSLGIWGLRANKPIPEKDQSEITATIHGLVDAVDRMRSHRDRVRAKEQAQLQTEIPSTPSNVIPLFKKTLRSTSSFSSNKDKRWMIKLDCLIESTSPEDIHKMAVELHAHSRRYAFFEYGDLQPSVRENLSELLQLGAVTLFIPNIMSLKLSEQEVLRQLIQTPTVQRPLLMVGARLPYSDLRQEPSVQLDFLVLLSQAYIKLSRPFSEYKDKGLIHYFLDSLSQDP